MYVYLCVCLQIQFIGEEGEDVGGVAKEFFMLLSQRILSPDFGMFLEVEDSHFSWFQDGVGHMTPYIQILPTIQAVQKSVVVVEAV